MSSLLQEIQSSDAVRKPDTTGLIPEVQILTSSPDAMHEPPRCTSRLDISRQARIGVEDYGPWHLWSL